MLISLSMVRLLPIALLSALAAQPTLAATVKVDVGIIGCTISIQGQIDGKTPGQLQAAVHRANDLSRKQRNQPCDPGSLFPGRVIFNSPGGDVESAIALGKIIRQTNFGTGVDRSCASACVIAFLGGVTRSVIVGQIGLHRPYAKAPSESIKVAQERYEKLNALLHDYFKEMKIPLRVLEVMNSIPPGDIKILSGLDDTDQDRLRELGITGSDPIWADVYDTRRAAKIGISRSEYYARQQRANAECWAKDAKGSYVHRDPGLCSYEIVRGKKLGE